MRRQFVRTLSLVAALALASGCDSSTTTPTTPSTSTTTTTETFEGTLAKNAGVSYSFSAAASGTVTATLKAAGPDSTVPLGIGLGTWNGTSCQIVLTNDNALIGASVIGSLSSAASLCVRIFDVGRVTDAMTFTIDVVHP